MRRDNRQAPKRESWKALCARTRNLCKVSFEHALKYELPYSPGLDMDAIYKTRAAQKRAA